MSAHGGNIERVCLRCRRGMGDGEPCPSGRAGLIARLDDPVQREQLRGQAWQSTAKLEWLGTNWRLVFAGAGAVVGWVGSTALSLSMGDPGVSVFVGMGGALLGLIVCAAIAVAIPPPTSFYRRTAHGADARCAEPSGQRVRGRVGRAHGTQAPDGPLVSGVELLVDGQVTLHTGCAEALMIELEDGRRVHVPQGPVQLTGGPQTSEPLDASSVAALLRRIGGSPSSDFGEEAEGPIPANVGRAWSLREGAAVELRSATDVSTRQARGGAFRAAANRDLEPVGLVVLHVLGASSGLDPTPDPR